MSEKKILAIPVINREDANAFTDSEYEELIKYIQSGKGHNIAPSTAANFLALYLEGRTIEQIHQNFPEWPKGALLYARYYYKWDLQRQEYFLDLASKVKERLAKCKIETVYHLIDKLTVANKEFARDMEKWIQNPTDANLPKTAIRSNKDLKEAVTMLKEILLLGQIPEPAQPTATVNVNVTTQGEKTEVKITTDEHSAMLEKLAGKDENTN